MYRTLYAHSQEYLSLLGGQHMWEVTELFFLCFMSGSQISSNTSRSRITLSNGGAKMICSRQIRGTLVSRPLNLWVVAIMGKISILWKILNIIHFWTNLLMVITQKPQITRMFMRRLNSWIRMNLKIHLSFSCHYRSLIPHIHAQSHGIAQSTQMTSLILDKFLQNRMGSLTTML